jgi:hypothetical protein
MGLLHRIEASSSMLSRRKDLAAGGQASQLSRFFLIPTALSGTCVFARLVQ